MQAELKAEGFDVSIAKLCRWLGVSRRSYYYRTRTRQKAVDEKKAEQVKSVIERFPTYGYRRIAFMLDWNRKVEQRICQLKGWQVRKRSRGHRPRVKATPSVAEAPNQRWATDLARVWCGRDRWCHIALVIDCASRELLGWRLASHGNAHTAEAALEEALISRFGHLRRVFAPLQLRSDTVRAYGLTQEFIMPYSPEQNGMIERFIRTL